MSAPHEIISDEEIMRVHGHANFGDMSPREVVNDGVRKYAIGYTGGHTQLCILMEHGLITTPKPGKYSANLTKKGKRYAQAVSAAQPDLTQAAVTAALEGAASKLQNVADNWDCGHNESRLCDCGPYVEQWSMAADEIRALITAPQRDALQAVIDAAKADAREERIGTNCNELTAADRAHLIAHLSYELEPVGKPPTWSQLAMEVVRLSNSIAQIGAKP